MSDIRQEMRKILNIGDNEAFYLRSSTIRRWLAEVDRLHIELKERETVKDGGYFATTKMQ
jgi:hypothetical protein